MNLLWIISGYHNNRLISYPYITRELSSLIENIENKDIELYILCEDLTGTDEEYSYNKRIFDYNKSKGRTRIHTLTETAPEDYFAKQSELLSIINKYHIDLVHTEHLRGGVTLNDVIDQLKVPVINSYRASEIVKVTNPLGSFGLRHKIPGFEGLLRELLPKLTLHLPVSKYVSSFLYEFDISPQQVQVIYNGVDINEFKMNYKYRSSTELHNILTYKRSPTAIEAIATSLKRNNNLAFHFVGTPYNNHEQHMIDKMSLNKKIIHHGRLSPEVTRDLLAKCDLLFHPTWWDGCSNLVLESMAMKKTVVGSNDFGVNEQIRNNIDGLLFDPFNSEDMANKLCIAIKDIKLRKQLTDSAYARVHELFTSDLKTKNYYNIYDQILNTA